MTMYFKVYHKRSRQPLATYNERQIIDFCTNNKETISNYSFSVDRSKEIMDWELFAIKHADLFVQRAKEREEKERQVADSIEIQEPSKAPFYIIGVVGALVALAIVAALVYRSYLQKEEAHRVHDLSPAAPVEAAPEPEQKAVVQAPAKRDPRPGDTAFIGVAPDEKSLQTTWKKSKKKLIASLGPAEIKEEMDKYLPVLQKCFTDRAAAGDRNLKGTVNMKIRVAGDGTVLDVLFPDEKYVATLFADCLADGMKKENFRPFKSKEQTFSYYFDL